MMNKMELLDNFLKQKQIAFGKDKSIDHNRYDKSGSYDRLGDLMLEFAELYHESKLKNNGDLGLVSGSSLIKLSFRKVDETYYCSGEKIHNCDSYFLEKQNYKLHIRLFFNKPEILIWIKYNFNGNVNLSAENLKFYENQHIKRVETMSIDELILLIKALTGDELPLS